MSDELLRRLLEADPGEYGGYECELVGCAHCDGKLTYERVPDDSRRPGTYPPGQPPTRAVDVIVHTPNCPWVAALRHLGRPVTPDEVTVPGPEAPGGGWVIHRVAAIDVAEAIEVHGELTS